METLSSNWFWLVFGCTLVICHTISKVICKYLQTKCAIHMASVGYEQTVIKDCDEPIWQKNN